MSEYVKDVPEAVKPGLCNVLLALADDKFLLGHHNGDWTGLGPFLEADIAFSNIAQDEIAHAQELYKLVAALAGASAVVAEANQLAYARPSGERLNATIVESADDFDWAFAVTRQCFFDHADHLRLDVLRQSSFLPVAELAGKMIQEVSFHIEHFDHWMISLAQAGGEARQRVEQAVQHLWPLAGGLFVAVEGQDALASGAFYNATWDSLSSAWRTQISALCQRAGIATPQAPLNDTDAGRTGTHDQALAELLTEISEVFKVEPSAEW